MENTLTQVILTTSLEALFRDFSALTDLPCYLADLHGHIIAGPNQQKITADFHMQSLECREFIRLRQADIFQQLKAGQESITFEIFHGLHYAAVPVISGKNLIAVILTGLFFTSQQKKTQTSVFMQVAEKFGFDKQAYTDAIQNIPDFSEKKIHQFTNFMISLGKHLSSEIETNNELTETKQELNNKNRQLKESKQLVEEKIKERTKELLAANNKIIEENARREASEAELQKSEKKYRQLVESMNEGLVILDKKGVISFVNSRLCHMFGYSEEEVLGHSPVDFLDEQNKELFLERFGKRKEGLAWQYEIEWKHKNGHNFPTIVSPQVIYNEEGEFDGSVAVLTDLSVLRKAEDNLQKTEEKYRRFIEIMNEGFFTVNTKYEISYVNKRFCEILGYKPKDIIGKPIIKFIEKSYLPILLKKLSELENHRTKAFEVMMKDIQDNQVCCIFSPETLKDEEDNFAGSAVVVTDITHQKKVENELREKNRKLNYTIDELRKTEENLQGIRAEQEKFVALIENSLDYIGFTDMEDNLLYVNPAGARMIGLEHLETGLNLSDPTVITEKLKHFKQNNVWPTLLENGFWTGDMKLPNVNTGELFDVNVIMFCIDDPKTGQPKYIGSIQRDIRSMKKAEKELLKKNQELNRIINQLKETQIELIRAQEEQEKFFALVENSLDFISITDLESNVLYLNPAAIQMMGIEGYDYHINLLENDYMPKKAREDFKNNVLATLEKKGVWTSETKITHMFSGKTLDVSSIVFYILDPKTKERKYIASIQRDITEQKAAEKKLMEAHRELVSSEEELRQNTEELKSSNENLEKTKTELEQTLQKERATRDKLDQTLKKLMDTQSQLVNSERMASLGQLTAGIAHEINNPVNFVSSNISPLKLDLRDVKELLEKYESLHEAADPIDLLDKIRVFRDELEPEYLYREIESLLQGMEEGAIRTKEIVKGLRSFSRMDEEEFVPADIHEGIESALMLLRNKLKQNITVHKEFGEIPLIDCYPGKLNQCFLNILNNASQAIEGKGDIYIRTFQSDGKIFISFKDTGKGIPDEVKNRIFEPFFTTKDVGQGTGLGLSIVFGIINSHHGHIDVLSEPGKGAEFIIRLPVKQVERR